MDFRYEDDEDDDQEDDDERPRRRRVRKTQLFNSIRRRISVVKPKLGRSDEDDDEYSGDEGGNGLGFLKRKLKPKKKQKNKVEQTENNKKESAPTTNKKKNSKKKKENQSAPRDEDEEGDVAMPLPGQQDMAPVNVVPEATAPSNSKQKSSNGGLPSKPAAIRRRQRAVSNSSEQDRSVDTPPSVGSSDFSLENEAVNQHAQMQMQAREQQRLAAANKNKNGLPSLFRRGEDDETGAAMESMSMDYYYQSIPWIIKTWIYFLTVVVPFSLLYYCFVGLFHSTTLNQNPFLKKVAFANVLFGGLGCTFRSAFWARQTLDAKGVRAKVPGQALKKVVNGMNALRRIPRATRGRVETNDAQKVPPTILARLSTTGLLPRRKTLPSVTGVPLSLQVGSTLNGISSRILGTSSDRPTFTRNSSMDSTANRRPSISSNRQLPSGSGSGLMGGSGSNHSRLHPVNGGGTMGMGGSNHSNAVGPSVWDVENMIPVRKEKSSRNGRPSMDKHKSILEIYEVHADQEKIALLQ